MTPRENYERVARIVADVPTTLLDEWHTLDNREWPPLERLPEPMRAALAPLYTLPFANGTYMSFENDRALRAVIANRRGR